MRYLPRQRPKAVPEGLSGTFEPRHDKTSKMSVRPAKIQISLGIHPVWSASSLSGCPGWFASSMGAQSFCWFCHEQNECAPSEDSDQPGHPPSLISVFDWADAQADLSLRWAHSHFVGFVMSRLMLLWRLLLTDTNRTDYKTLSPHLV